MVSVRYCAGCGATVSPGARCGACGRPIATGLAPAGYRPADTRARWTLVLLAVLGLTTVLIMFATVGEISLLQRIVAGEFVSDAELIANDESQALMSLLYLAAFLGTIVVFCLWIHRASGNLRPLGARELSFSPGWAVGWWFVPIMQLFRPYQVMAEIWKASDPETPSDQPTAWVGTSGTPVLGFWWATWLIASFVSDIAARVLFQGDTAEDLIVSDWISLAGNALFIVAGVLVFILVRRIMSRQAEKARRVVESSAGTAD